MKIPRCMSTQHPDNVHMPFFCKSTKFNGEEEILETYYSFSHLGIEEQMWDYEGKEIDNYVVRKLLSKYSDYFRETKLGRDKFITLRVPNPLVEKKEAKILLETLESLPRSFDTAKTFYGDDISPIFEVILPMTTSSQCLERIYQYYSNFVIGKKNKFLYENDITVAEWIGDFKPEIINVIPLFEDMPHMLDAHNITRQFIKGKNISHQRVFLARSDPAANYGNISAVLLNKIALYNLRLLSENSGVNICPIIGLGSAPFRGNLKPHTTEKILNEYPSAHTYTIQSAFKYDNPTEDVISGIKKLNNSTPKQAQALDEKKCLEIIAKYTKEYQTRITELAVMINSVSRGIPSRRMRKLHTGLFGYSRNIAGFTLPRAITFTSSLYSIGIPPEILGLSALSRDDIKFIKSIYLNFENDLCDALMFYNPDNDLLPDENKTAIENLGINFEINREHKEIAEHIKKDILRGGLPNFDELVLKAASIRRFLG